MSLYTKVICLVTLVVIGVGICSSLLVDQVMRGALVGELEEKAVIVAETLAESVTRDVVNHNRIPVRDTIHEIVRRTQDVDYAFIVGFDHEVFAHTFEGGFPRALLCTAWEVPRTDARHQNRYRCLISERAILDVSYPLVDDMVAHVHVGVNESRLERHVAALRNRILGLTFVAMLSAVGLAVVVSRHITRPLGKLVDSMRAFGEGKSGQEIHFRGGGSEVADLTRSFNRMITEREQAEEALRESEDRYRILAERNPHGIEVIDPTGIITYVNPTYQEMFGYTKEELLGKCTVDLLDPVSKRPELHEYLSLLVKEQPEPTTYFQQKRRKDGEVIEQAVSWNYSRDGEGNVVGFISVITDITERKQAERERENLIVELESKNAELERFTYTVSHDLKSPLVTISGFLGMLKQDAEAGNAEAMEEDLTFISNATRKMEQLLDELLDLSRIGRQVNPPSDIALADLAQEVVSMTSEKMAERGIQVEISPDLPVVFGDRIRLWEVLQNLVDNAAKFMGDQPDPRIEIGSRRDGEETVCYIRDNGMGIDPAYHEKVFGLFDRLDPKSEGTGVGLAIVKRIVEVHGGRVWVESGGPGQGSTFCFTIPRKREETSHERD